MDLFGSSSWQLEQGGEGEKEGMKLGNCTSTPPPSHFSSTLTTYGHAVAVLSNNTQKTPSSTPTPVPLFFLFRLFFSYSIKSVAFSVSPVCVSPYMPCILSSLVFIFRHGSCIRRTYDSPWLHPAPPDPVSLPRLKSHFR
jgi:hypothetical protein